MLAGPRQMLGVSRSCSALPRQGAGPTGRHPAQGVSTGRRLCASRGCSGPGAGSGEEAVLLHGPCAQPEGPGWPTCSQLPHPSSPLWKAALFLRPRPPSAGRHSIVGQSCSGPGAFPYRTLHKGPPECHAWGRPWSLAAQDPCIEFRIDAPPLPGESMAVRLPLASQGFHCRVLHRPALGPGQVRAAVVLWPVPGASSLLANLHLWG